MLPEAATVRLTVLDVAGRVRAVLAEGPRAAGRHTLRWDGRVESGAKLPTGVYLLRLEAAGRESSQKLILAHWGRAPRECVRAGATGRERFEFRAPARVSYRTIKTFALAAKAPAFIRQK
jgi:flagellar hook assembly protein FlgD